VYRDTDIEVLAPAFVKLVVLSCFEAKDSTLKAKTKDFKIVLEDEDLSSRTPTLLFQQQFIFLIVRIPY